MPRMVTVAPTNTLFVCVNKSYKPVLASNGLMLFTLAELERVASGNWCITVAKALTCFRVVAVAGDFPLGAWLLRGAYPSKETYVVNQHRVSVRTTLHLGEALPLIPSDSQIPSMRQGVAVRPNRAATQEQIHGALAISREAKVRAAQIEQDALFG